MFCAAASVFLLAKCVLKCGVNRIILVFTPCVLWNRPVFLVTKQGSNMCILFFCIQNLVSSALRICLEVLMLNKQTWKFFSDQFLYVSCFWLLRLFLW